MSFEGGQVEGSFNNLVVESLQDVVKERMKGFSMSIGTGSSGVGAEGSFHVRDGKWSNAVGGIIATQTLNLIVKDTLEVVGGIIARAEIDESGRLIDKHDANIEAAKVAVKQLYDYDKGKTLGSGLYFSLESKEADTGSRVEYSLDRSPIKYSFEKSTRSINPVLSGSVKAESTEGSYHRDTSQHITDETSERTGSVDADLYFSMLQDFAKNYLATAEAVGVASGEHYTKDNKEDEVEEELSIIIKQVTDQPYDKTNSNVSAEKDKTYAKLCDISYEADLVTIKELVKEYGYEVVGTLGSPNKFGYFGVALKNKESNDIIITHRGTETDFRNKKLISVHKDFMDDIRISLGKLPTQITKAESFTKQIQEQYPNSKIMQIGHSLGGVYAELLGVKYNQYAYSYDSPGTKTLAAQFAPGISVQVDKIKITKSVPNLVNSCGENLHNNITQINVSIEDKNVSFHGYIGLTKALHSITGMHKNFENKIERQSWPSSIDQAYCEFKYGKDASKDDNVKCKQEINEELNSIILKMPPL